MNDDEFKQLAKSKGVKPEDLKTIARSIFGTMGGKAGTGASKRRSPECYQKAVAARNRQREERRKANGLPPLKPKKTGMAKAIEALETDCAKLGRHYSKE